MMSDEVKKNIVEKLGPEVKKYFRLDEPTKPQETKLSYPGQKQKEEQIIRAWFPEIATRLEQLEARLTNLEHRPAPTCSCMNLLT